MRKYYLSVQDRQLICDALGLAVREAKNDCSSERLKAEPELVDERDKTLQHCQTLQALLEVQDYEIE